MRGKGCHLKADGWYFYQAECAKSVICAEKRLPWYDDERFEALEKLLKKQGCRTYNCEIVIETKRKRKTTVIEIYKQFKDTPFDDKVKEMLEIIRKNKIE